MLHVHVGGQPTDIGTISSPDGSIKFEVITLLLNQYATNDLMYRISSNRGPTQISAYHYYITTIDTHILPSIMCICA